MRRTPLLAVLALVMAGGTAQATEVGISRNFGVGFQLGDPTAIVAKAFLNGNDAIDFGLGIYGYGRGYCYDDHGSRYWCNGGHGSMSVHADYLYQENIIHGNLKLDWHVGGGGRVIFWNYGDSGHSDVALLGRVPLGFDFTFRRPSFLEAYIEIAPAIVVIPPLDFTIDFGLGVRAYF